jgi:squalene-hopene/tetraprenyl-beta-curcumene cyclase
MNVGRFLYRAALGLVVLSAPIVFAREDITGDKCQAAIDKSIDWLKSQQKPDGGWQTDKDPPAFTAIVLRCLLGDAKMNHNDPMIQAGFKKVLTYQMDKGGIFKDLQGTYNTAIAVSALAAAKNPRYQEPIDKAVAYLKSLQWSDAIANLPDGSKVDEKNPNFGGWGYGSHGRADGSNVQMALEALKDAGLKSDDPAYQNAIKFLSREQNLSESNDQSWASDDGGFVYTPGNNGESQAGDYTDANGKRLLRSYGSMTYAGLKSMIYAGLKKDDPRVKAAWAWIAKNYTVEMNPGMELNNPANADDGLFYYYMTMGRALRAYGEQTITDAQGNKHDWRIDLINKIIALQKADGSWEDKKRFMEQNPVLATCEATLGLEEALADLQAHPILQ